VVDGRRRGVGGDGRGEWGTLALGFQDTGRPLSIGRNGPEKLTGVKKGNGDTVPNHFKWETSSTGLVRRPV
jgi:hypothetical protein